MKNKSKSGYIRSLYIQLPNERVEQRTEYVREEKGDANGYYILSPFPSLGILNTHF